MGQAISLNCFAYQFKSQFSHQLGSEVTFALSLSFLTWTMGEKRKRIRCVVEALLLEFASREITAALTWLLKPSSLSTEHKPIWKSILPFSRLPSPLKPRLFSSLDLCSRLKAGVPPESSQPQAFLCPIMEGSFLKKTQASSLQPPA